MAGRLIYHPAPYPDEGMKGFVLRVSEGNLLPQSRLIWNGEEPSLQVLADRVGIDVGNLERFSSQFTYPSVRPLWNKTYCRICPVCLDQDGHSKQFWELSLATCCPRHGIVLRDTCDTCGEMITWHRSRLRYCKCGHSYTRLPVETASNDEWELNQVIDSALMGQPHLISITKELSILRLHKLVLMLGIYANRNVNAAEFRKQSIRRIDDVRPIIMAAASVLLYWPKGFFTMLDRIQNTGVVDSQRLGKRFGRFYEHLYDHFKDPEYGFVLDAFEKYLQRSWQHALAGRNKRLSTYTRNRHSWLPVQLVAKDLKCGIKSITRLIEEGSIESTSVTTAKGRKMVCINRQQLGKISALLNDRVDLGTASKMLGISQNRFRQLAYHEVIGKAVFATESRDKRWQISRSTIDNLLVLSNALPIIKCDENTDVTLQYAFQYLFHREYIFPRLVLDMIKSVFEPKGRLNAKDGVSAWIYDKKQLQGWISDLIRGERKGALSITQLAVELNIKEQEAYVLTALGAIKAIEEKDTGYRIVELEEIQHFRERYVFARDLAKQYQTTSREVIKKLSESGIKPINQAWEFLGHLNLYENSLNDLVL